MLTRHGFPVMEASGGLEAVGMYQLFRPAVVFLDLYMEDLDGLATLSRIRSKDPQARVVFMSVYSSEAAVKKAFSSGASDFLTKPFQEERVLKALMRILNQCPEAALPPAD
ncbi:MAG: response regulator, partial [Syntrophomonadaceae bacterium]|nr:response regulator [Syntrophomonadaceae bacterium]